MRKAPTLGTPFDYRDGLPSNLVLAKPVEQPNYDPVVLQNTPGGFPLMATRKWNGWRLIATFVPARKDGEGQIIRLYRDGVNDDGVRHRADQYLPHIVADLQQLHIPSWSVLSTEVVAMRGGVERLGAVGSILNMANPADAFARQEREGRLRLLLHGALCWNDQWLADTPYDQVLAKLNTVAPATRKDGHVRTVGLEMGTLAETQQRAYDNDWEGLVYAAHTYCFTWRMDKPDSENPRPDLCYKWKPQQTADCIAVDPRMSTARTGRIKDVQLLQVAPDGRRFKCGHLGNFTAEVDAQLQRRGFPQVLEVLFDGRTPAGKLVNPRFVGIRDDKKANQCVSGKGFAEAQYVGEKKKRKK